MQNRLQKSYWRLQDRYNLMWEVTKCYQRAKWNTPTQNKWHQSMFRCYQCPVLYDFLIFHVHIQKSPLFWSTATQRPNGHKPNFAYVLVRSSNTVETQKNGHLITLKPTDISRVLLYVRTDTKNR